MASIKRILSLLLLAAIAAAVAVALWAHLPLTRSDGAPISFEIKAGSSVRGSARQIAAAGVPVNPTLLALLARLSRTASHIKAGTYELKPGTTPIELLAQLVHGEVAQEAVAIIEGWTFDQMRAAVDANPDIRHDTLGMSDAALLAQIDPAYHAAEGLFFPDTYMFAKGTSDLQIYKEAHELMLRHLNEEWAKRAPGLPYKTPYDALIMASIIEKETGQTAERGRIAAVFINRLKQGMLLQTDPTVIYGMGKNFHGNIRKNDLSADTPYNTYVHPGLPPTPIALPGMQSLLAALNPVSSDALYFVSRGDGTTEFSASLADHNRAVNKYQREQR